MRTRPCTTLVVLSFACQGQLANPSLGPAPPTLDDSSAFAVSLPAAPAAAGATAPPAPAVDAAAPQLEASAPLGEAQSAATASAIVDASAGTLVPEGACPASLTAGDLAIDELMVESVAGSGDDGEWLEVRNARDCAVDLLGLHGECPKGNKVIVFDVATDLWIPPGASFVVADSAVPAINHSLPGPLVVWSGRQGDVLRNKGSTLTLRFNGAVIDTLTYPAFTLEVGASLAFPSDCDPSERDDFSKWQVSASSWFPGFLGTPNAPNDDVHCP